MKKFGVFMGCMVMVMCVSVAMVRMCCLGRAMITEMPAHRRWQMSAFPVAIGTATNSQKPLAERAALRVLPAQPDRHPLGQEAGKPGAIDEQVTLDKALLGRLQAGDVEEGRPQVEQADQAITGRAG